MEMTNLGKSWTSSRNLLCEPPQAQETVYTGGRPAEQLGFFCNESWRWLYLLKVMCVKHLENWKVTK